jgi:hypothetical protein
VVRYSSEPAAVNAAERGGELLERWEVIWWPPSYVESHPETSRFEAVPESDVQRFWPAGARTVQSGLSHADAVDEAARRCTLAEQWCVLPDGDRYTVKPAEGLSLAEKDHVRATCDSEQEAWQAIPSLKAEDDHRMKLEKQRYQEWEKTQHRWDYLRVGVRGVLLVGLVVAATWLIITIIHWFWQHPLF